MKVRTILFVFLALLASCSKRPDDIIKEDKMVEIMADLQIAEAYSRFGKAEPDMDGSNRELLGRGVLMSHGVTVEEMDSTLAWYGRNMDEYSKLYKKVDEHLARKQQKYAKAAGESNNSGPSTDIWPYGRHFVIDRNQTTDGLVVSIPLPEIETGDKLTWKMRTFGATSRRMTLGVDYDNGRSEIVNISNRALEPWIETSLQTDSLRTVTRIFAILEVERSTPKVFIDSVQMLHHPFNREEYHSRGYQHSIGAPAHTLRELPADTVHSEKTDTLKIESVEPQRPKPQIGADQTIKKVKKIERKH